MASSGRLRARLSVRYSLDSSWRRCGATVLAGSPQRLFRLGPAGTRVADAIAAGNEVEDSVLTDRLCDAGAIHPVPTRSRRFEPADVTVVTPSLNAPPRTGRYTVDDGSNPPLDGAALRLDENRGPGAARNAGRQLVTTPLVAFVDADVDLPDETTWLEPLLGHFDDPGVGLVAPRVTGERNSPLDLGGVTGRIRAATRISYVPAAVILVRVDAFDSVGGFDETLRFGEDVDFVWRLDQAGWHCRYEPTSTVWHRPRATFTGRLRQHRTYGESAAALALRHPRELAPWHVDPPTAGMWLALLCGRPALALAVQRANVSRIRATLAGFPAADVARFLGEAHIGIGRQLAGAVRREWWPVALAASLFSRRARVMFALALLLSPRRVATDAAYGAGVWSGAIRKRTTLPLRPDIRGWAPNPPPRPTEVRSAT